MTTELMPGHSIIIKNDGRNLDIFIKEDGKPKAHWPGWLKLQRNSVADGNVWEVSSAQALHGYGPLLYDLAMEYVTNELGDLGITPDTVDVTKDAQNVWGFYLTRRPDVEHEELPATYIHAKDRPEPLQYYYYKIGTPYLDRFREMDLLEIVE